MSNINTFIKAVNNSTGFLLGNRYQVTMSKLNGINMSLFCSKVDLPSIDYAQVDLDIGGKLVHVPNKLSLGDLQLTFYNTGAELKAIHNYCDASIFIKNTHAIGYYDDIAMDIQVLEYNHKNNLIISRQYANCILKSISPITLSYNEATEVQSFTIGFTCESITVK